MEENKQNAGPDHTAIRVALWRALHVQHDAPPHIIEDELGLRLAHPGNDWKARPDMDPEATKYMRASIVARARFVEDLAVEASQRGIAQYVILGAGLDTFALRRPEIASRLRVFEIDKPSMTEWKAQRIAELDLLRPGILQFVPVDFEGGASWSVQLAKAGFDARKPAFVSCTGVTLYLTREAILNTLQQVAQLAPGSQLAMTFILPPELIEAGEKPMQQTAEKGAKAAGTPFVSFFSPEEMRALAQEAGLKKTEMVSGSDLASRYFRDRTDHFAPSNAEQFLLAWT